MDVQETRSVLLQNKLTVIFQFYCVEMVYRSTVWLKSSLIITQLLEVAAGVNNH